MEKKGEIYHLVELMAKCECLIRIDCNKKISFLPLNDQILPSPSLLLISPHCLYRIALKPCLHCQTKKNVCLQTPAFP